MTLCELDNIFKTFKINKLKTYRTSLNNFYGKSIILFCMKNDIDEAIKVFKERYSDKTISEICVFPEFDSNSYVFENCRYKIRKPVKSLKNKNIAIYINKEKEFSFVGMLNHVAKHTNNTYYLYSSDDYIPHFDSPFNKEEQIQYVSNNIDKFVHAYSILEDKHSKKIFSASIDTLCYGSSSKLKDEDFVQYDHPEVHASYGDIIISGGLGISLEDSALFCEKIKSSGKVYAFEPIRKNIEILKQYIDNYESIKNNFEIVPLGLWNKKDTLYFSDNVDASSCVWNDNNCSSICQVISIDEFVAENNIERVDMIKMDIEGAENEALEGAYNTIKQYRPKLAISVYHRPDHLISIILFINSLNLGYKFYLAHHSNHYEETVLYAKVPNLYKDFLIKNKVAEQFEKLVKNIGNKKVVLYAPDDFVFSLFEELDMSKLNIQAIAKPDSDNSDNFKGFKVITPELIKNLEPDYVLVCTTQALAAIEYLRYQLLIDKNIKVLPFVKRSFISTLKEIWR